MNDQTQNIFKKTEDVVVLARRIWRQEFTMPDVRLEHMGTVLGKYYHHYNRITFNPKMIPAMYDHYMTNTVPHEVAHMVVHHLYPNAKQAHGPEFRFVAGKLGCASTKAKATINNAAAEIMVSSGKYVPYRCACTSAKPRLMTRIQAAKSERGFGYTCKYCQTAIIPIR